MKYQLISNGRLLKGRSETVCIEQIKLITGLSEEKIRQSLLSGKRAKLTSSPDREKLRKLRRSFREAGLDVEILPVEEKSVRIRSKAKAAEQPSTESSPSPAMPRLFRWRRLAVVVPLLLLVAAGGLGGYAWSWLHRSPPPEVVAAEEALFDGSLVAVGMVDVEKLAALERYWFGDLDPGALPLDEQKRGLLGELFSGPPRFSENLSHILFSLSLQPEEGPGRQLMLLAGRFKANALLGTIGKHYELEKIDDGHWAVTKKEEPRGEPLCEKDEPAEADVFYLRFSPAWVMLSDDQAHGEEVWQRLHSGATASQPDLALWRSYRAERLLSLMAMVPADAGKALGGMPGMMASGAASESPQVDAVGMALDLAPMPGGMNVNLHIRSGDSTWNRETEAAIRRKLEAMEQGRRGGDSALSEMLSRVSVAGREEALDIDLKLDSAALDELDQVVQEGMAGLFGMGTPNGGGERPVERVDENPQQYVSLAFSDLPPYEDKYQSEPPLFSSAPFSVDFKSIKPNGGGVLEIWLEGKVGLPDNEDRRFNNIGEFSIGITSVRDAAGEELLRDERCLEMSELGGRSPNHEKESSTNHQQDHGWVWKFVRLNPGVTVERIALIDGTLSFSVPTQVRRFEVPLQTGEVVEHAGLRFHLSGIKSDSVSYQVSGEGERLLEVRGLNQEQRVLRRGWKVTDTGSGRVTQSYAGEVRALEIYVAERYFRRKTDFMLKDLFSVSEKDEEGEKPQWFAPERIDPKQWHAYGELNLDKLTIDPKKDWQIWDKNVTPIAEGRWPPVRMFITHTPKQWGNNPTAHIYFPQIPELPGVLSGFGYRIDEPAVTEGAGERYQKANYWYNSRSGEVLVKHTLEGRPMALNNISLATGLGDNQKLKRLKGEIIYRLPRQTRSTKLLLSELWDGKSIDGITVTLQEVSRGMFPGYGLQVEGEIEKLVNLHGLSARGERIIASPVNFQDGGYWTMTLPFGKGIEEVELVTSPVQEVLRYPFDFEPEYAAE